MNEWNVVLQSMTYEPSHLAYQYQSWRPWHSIVPAILKTEWFCYSQWNMGLCGCIFGVPFPLHFPLLFSSLLCFFPIYLWGVITAYTNTLWWRRPLSQTASISVAWGLLMTHLLSSPLLSSWLQRQPRPHRHHHSVSRALHCATRCSCWGREIGNRTL